jgi:hypothetical protein
MIVVFRLAFMGRSWGQGLAKDVFVGNVLYVKALTSLIILIGQ